PATESCPLSLHDALPISIGAANIAWNGPWISRWSGRDTDLFFVFTKHFHILLAEFLPPDLERVKRICAPGLLSVHAQLLVVLERSEEHTSELQSRFALVC